MLELGILTRRRFYIMTMKWLSQRQVTELWGVNDAYIRTSIKQSPTKWPEWSYRKTRRGYEVTYNQMENLLGAPTGKVNYTLFERVYSPLVMSQFDFNIQVPESIKFGVLALISKYSNIAGTSFTHRSLRGSAYLTSDVYEGSMELSEVDIMSFIAEMEEFRTFSHFGGNFTVRADIDLTRDDDGSYEYRFEAYRDANYALIRLKPGVSVKVRHYSSPNEFEVMERVVESVDRESRTFVTKPKRSKLFDFISDNYRFEDIECLPAHIGSGPRNFDARNIYDGGYPGYVTVKLTADCNGSSVDIFELSTPRDGSVSPMVLGNDFDKFLMLAGDRLMAMKYVIPDAEAVSRIFIGGFPAVDLDMVTSFVDDYNNDVDGSKFHITIE